MGGVGSGYTRGPTRREIEQKKTWYHTLLTKLNTQFKKFKKNLE